VPEDAVLVAARVQGGAWHQARGERGKARASVPVRFGPQTLEVRVASPAGVVRDVTVNVTNTRQPEPADPPGASGAPPGAGVVVVPGLGPIDLHGPASTIVAASGPGVVRSAGPTEVVTDVPNLLPDGTRAVYRGLGDEKYLIAEFDSAGVRASCVTTGGRTEFRFAGGPASGGVHVGSTGLTDATTRTTVDYVFDPSGRLVQLGWPDPEAQSTWPTVWVRVKDIGSTEPVAVPTKEEKR